MQNLSIEQCQQDLAALDARDKLSDALKDDIEKLMSGDINPMKLIQKAGMALAAGNLSPETLGLSKHFFEHYEQLEKLNQVASRKLREHVQAQMAELQKMTDIEEAGSDEA